ncbi:MAG TPA: hypothetical protein PK156_33520 [Polyangium sp.]|nr:hypothetical protein [Polyangium sp.]
MSGWFDRIRNALGITPKSSSEPAPEETTVSIPNVSDLLGLASPPTDLPTGQQILRQIDELKLSPVAFQALWDGDTEGWFLRLEMVHRRGDGYAAVCVAALRFGGDIRVFSGQVPPWPESVVGTKLGEALARRFHVPFYFPSPKDPDDDCPNWWEQDRAIRCADCDKQIVPSDSPHLPKDVCYHCHSERERKKNIRMDVPDSPNGVRILVGKDDSYKGVSYSSEAKGVEIVQMVFEEPGRQAAAHEHGQIVFEGDELELLAAKIETRLEVLLASFNPDKHLQEIFPNATRAIEYRGRTLELNMYDDQATSIMLLIEHLKSVQRAQDEHLRLWFVFRRGMTKRGDHLLRIAARGQSSTSIAQLVDTCRGVLDETEIRVPIEQPEKLGHVRCSGDEVRITAMGRAIL